MPAHNEELRIDRTLHDYRHALDDPEVRFEVALDGCADGTAAIVRRHAEEDPRVGWTDYPKLGKGGVLLEAFRASALGDAEPIAFVSADGATHPSEPAPLAKAVHSGSDRTIDHRRPPRSHDRRRGRKTGGR